MTSFTEIKPGRWILQYQSHFQINVYWKLSKVITCLVSVILDNNHYTLSTLNWKANFDFGKKKNLILNRLEKKYCMFIVIFTVSIVLGELGKFLWFSKCKSRFPLLALFSSITCLLDYDINALMFDSLNCFHI